MAALLQAHSLGKSYGTTPVLTDFDFELGEGEVHALVGSNGAGKSTFARVLCGLTPATSGRVTLAGENHAPASKKAAEASGVVMVLQELNLIPTLSVAENLFLDRLPAQAGWVNRAVLHRQATEALARMGLESVAPETPAGALGVGQQQMVEIAGALARDCKVLILDEPTAALTDPEIEALFENITRMRAEGVGIIYISHRMDEIRRIADEVTVLRDGRRVATYAAKDTEPAMLVRDMVGHEVADHPSTSERTLGEVALKVEHLEAGAAVKDVSLSVRFGEILGVAGLIGAGRTETLRAIFGADPSTAGTVTLKGRVVSFGEPHDAVDAGLAMVPEDRKHDGLLLPHSVRMNASLATLGRHAGRGGWIDGDGESAAAETLSKRVELKANSLDQAVGELSGGNQQKVVMARWLACDADVLMLDEPTRGIDVAAKETLYRIIREQAAAGKAVIVVSSDLPELMSLCDRIAVMSVGRVTAEFLPDEWSREKITEAAFAGHLNN